MADLIMTINEVSALCLRLVFTQSSLILCLLESTFDVLISWTFLSQYTLGFFGQTRFILQFYTIYASCFPWDMSFFCFSFIPTTYFLFLSTPGKAIIMCFMGIFSLYVYAYILICKNSVMQSNHFISFLLLRCIYVAICTSNSQFLLAA